jgi:hypothetical protein
MSVKMAADYSDYGPAVGYARLPLDLGTDRRSITHRSLAVGLSGYQSGEEIAIRGLELQGVELQGVG